MGYSEGFVCNFLEEFPTGPIPDSAAFHVGGVANPNYYKAWWSMRGIYFWRRALEENEHKELKQNYEEKFGAKRSIDIFENSPEYKPQTDQKFFDFVENIILQKPSPSNLSN